jgi:hypothetical protein
LIPTGFAAGVLETVAMLAIPTLATSATRAAQSRTRFVNIERLLHSKFAVDDGRRNAVACVIGSPVFIIEVETTRANAV